MFVVFVKQLDNLTRTHLACLLIPIDNYIIYFNGNITITTPV